MLERERARFAFSYVLLRFPRLVRTFLEETSHLSGTSSFSLVGSEYCFGVFSPFCVKFPLIASPLLVLNQLHHREFANGKLQLLQMLPMRSDSTMFLNDFQKGL